MGHFFGNAVLEDSGWQVFVAGNDIYPRRTVLEDNVGGIEIATKILNDFAANHVTARKRHMKALRVGARKIMADAASWENTSQEREYKPKKAKKITQPDAYRKRLKKMENLAF